MSDYIDEYREKGFNPFQLREIEEGLKNGLTTSQVELYAKDVYDNMQMQEIRLGLEHGLTERQMSVFLNPSIGYEEMRYSRIQVEDLNVINENANADLLKKKVSIGARVVIVLALLVVVGIGGYVGRNYIQSAFQDIDLELTDSEITLNYGETFKPMNYVKAYTKEDGVELILPSSVDTNEVGTQTVIYKLNNLVKSVSKELKINVVDSDAPTITLNKKEVTLTRGEDTFSCKAYLSSANDTVDGDLTDEVTCKSKDTDEGKVDEKKDKQTIIYSVTDKTGNEGSATLTLKYVDPEPEPTPIIIYQNTNNNTSNRSSSTSSGNNSSGSGTNSGGSTYVAPQQSHGTEYYMFSDGYDFDTAYGACVASMNSHGNGSCTPLTGDDGNYTGYRLDY